MSGATYTSRQIVWNGEKLPAAANMGQGLPAATQPLSVPMFARRVRALLDEAGQQPIECAQFLGLTALPRACWPEGCTSLMSAMQECGADYRLAKSSGEGRQKEYVLYPAGPVSPHFNQHAFESTVLEILSQADGAMELGELGQELKGLKPPTALVMAVQQVPNVELFDRLDYGVPSSRHAYEAHLRRPDGRYTLAQFKAHMRRLAECDSRGSVTSLQIGAQYGTNTFPEAHPNLPLLLLECGFTLDVTGNTLSFSLQGGPIRTVEEWKAVMRDRREAKKSAEREDEEREHGHRGPPHTAPVHSPASAPLPARSHENRFAEHVHALLRENGGEVALSRIALGLPKDLTPEKGMAKRMVETVPGVRLIVKSGSHWYAQLLKPPSLPLSHPGTHAAGPGYEVVHLTPTRMSIPECTARLVRLLGDEAAVHGRAYISAGAMEADIPSRTWPAGMDSAADLASACGFALLSIVGVTIVTRPENVPVVCRDIMKGPASPVATPAHSLRLTPDRSQVTSHAALASTRPSVREKQPPQPATAAALSLESARTTSRLGLADVAFRVSQAVSTTRDGRLNSKAVAALLPKELWPIEAMYERTDADTGKLLKPNLQCLLTEAGFSVVPLNDSGSFDVMFDHDLSDDDEQEGRTEKGSAYDATRSNREPHLHGPRGAARVLPVIGRSDAVRASLADIRAIVSNAQRASGGRPVEGSYLTRRTRVLACRAFWPIEFENGPLKTMMRAAGVQVIDPGSGARTFLLSATQC